MKRILATCLAVLCFLAAVGIMLYPMVSSYVNEKYRSEIQTVYEEQVQQKDDSAIREAWERAVAYNEAITPGTMESDAYSKEAILAASQDYDAMLNITGSGIMGYVEIPKLDVYLPIFHGTGSDSLERGVGHLVGSSLPVGGESTHTVLTGHSGMASQRLFTDLEKLQSGDVFYLHVLDQVLAYQVDRIDTVLPYDSSLLGIYPGEDLCTLVTCTPIGINTHRLLVRGHRIEYAVAVEVQEEIQEQQEEPQSSWQEQYYLGLWLGVISLLVIGFVLAFAALIRHLYRRKNRNGGRYLRKKEQNES